jgi:hydrogenase/urease accessory protein HupE
VNTSVQLCGEINSSILSQKLFFSAFMIIMLCSISAFAHEIRPAYLEITQASDSTYNVFWKVPAVNNQIPKITPQLPFELTETSNQNLVDSYIRQYTGIWNTSLSGETISIDKLDLTLIDALVQINLKEDISYSFLLQPDQTSYIVPKEPSRWQVVKLYTELGIEHILIGIDHLLFVLGLLLLVNGVRLLIQTITAFTIAHSITLALSALDLVHVPQAPVEAVIALSIVFLAREYLMVLRGHDSLTARYPWLVAFTFGLLHGFGFAGVLQEIGLPQQDVPLALLTFNIGVEIGQLIFISIILIFFKIYKSLNVTTPKWLINVVPYLLGAISSFWLIERILGF